MYHDWRHCSAIGRHALFIGCGLSFVALLLVAEFIIADAIPRRDDLKRIWRCGSFPPHGVKYLRDLYGPLTDRSGSMVTL